MPPQRVECDNGGCGCAADGGTAVGMESMEGAILFGANSPRKVEAASCAGVISRGAMLLAEAVGAEAGGAAGGEAEGGGAG